MAVERERWGPGRPRCRWLLCCAITLGLIGCGRVGYVLTPLAGETPDSTPSKDSSPPEDAGQDTSVTCATPCNNDHGSADCDSGTCSLSCDRDFGDCNLDPEDGCESNLETGAQGDCGECGNLCSDDEACEAGTCEQKDCPQGFAECDGDLAEYCETDLRKNVDHCGACDDPCSNEHGTSDCVDSACVLTCEPGYDDCDGSARNGCESPLDTVADCGTCNRTCPASGGTPVCVDASCDTVCDLTGTWALKLSTTLEWAETMYVAGSAEQPYTMSLRVQIAQTGENLELQLTECQRVVPEFEAKFPNERSLLSYPDSLYDDHVLPPVSLSATLESTRSGASFVLPAVASQLGISLSDPVHDAWPGEEAAVPGANRIDMDGDGEDGVTARYTDQAPYNYPRTTALVTPDPPRSAAVYLGARAVFALDGTLTNCSESSGSAGFTRVDTRMFGCTIAGSERECDGNETSRIDQSVMTYVPEPGSYVLRKVDEGVDCATVRASLL